ncbi:MAG: hypothetical protein HY606_07125 [Planctomycetes bacterium]|nr:hypothetical protein [Planctomycetota bacterium]
MKLNSYRIILISIFIISLIVLLSRHNTSPYYQISEVRDSQTLHQQKATLEEAQESINDIPTVMKTNSNPNVQRFNYEVPVQIVEIKGFVYNRGGKPDSDGFVSAIIYSERYSILKFEARSYIKTDEHGYYNTQLTFGRESADYFLCISALKCRSLSDKDKCDNDIYNQSPTRVIKIEENVKVITIDSCYFSEFAKLNISVDPGGYPYVVLPYRVGSSILSRDYRSNTVVPANIPLQIQVGRHGYRQQEINIEPLYGGEIRQVLIKLESGSQVFKGRIVDPYGFPLSAAIELLIDGKRECGYGTNNEGVFTIPNLPNKIIDKVEFHVSSYNPDPNVEVYHKPLILYDVNPNQELTITAIPETRQVDKTTYIYRGRCLDKEGNQISGMMVGLETSDQEGYFEFESSHPIIENLWITDAHKRYKPKLFRNVKAGTFLEVVFEQ